MRLEKIKLAGFKSFVDPTTVLLPSNLVAVVGPNGCGKSNVIDAVRWVMGESSARMLRGESMTDVIFNGSSARKPVGQAVIELVFDNSDGSAGGQYANYNQISVRRLVSRDGLSSYFLNGTRCRRRDITDLFLGTGLGPRSYSIIEQGTISRLIEARPEDLRAFLEEAAGISKYKERRRETETRIRSTRENLERLDDLREEVAKYLQHLERQAATAERYTSLRAEERRRRAELLALRRAALDRELEREERRISQLETGAEAAVAGQRRLEAELEEARVHLHEAGDRFNEVQGRYYAVGAEIARAEQALQFQRESRSRSQRELAQAGRDLTAAQAQLRLDEARLADLAAALAAREPELARLEAEEGACGEALEGAEEAMHAWQAEWEDFNREAAAPAQRAQVERTRLNHLEQQVADLERRGARLADELGRLEHSGLDEEIGQLELAEQECRGELLEERARLEDAAARIQALRSARAEQVRVLDGLKEALQTTRGRRASLEALQQAGRGGQAEALQQWIADQGLEVNGRLTDHLEVEPAWQPAAEMVLGAALQAYCTDSLDRHAAALGGEEGPLYLLETGAAGAAGPTAGPRASLGTRVQAPWPLTSLLGGVDTAADLGDALARRTGLAPGESLVTPRGAWVGRDWLRLPGRDPAGSGVLERSAELKALAGRLGELERRAGEAQGQLEGQQRALEEAEAERERTQAELDRLNRELARTRSDLSARRARREHLEQRREAVHLEVGEVTGQVREDREAMAEARERLHGALEESETLALRREGLSAGRDGLRADLGQARAAARATQEQTRRLALEVESARAARDSLITASERLRGQVAELERRESGLALALAEAEEPLQDLEAELEQGLTRRLAAEGELAEARQALDAVNTAMREGEQARQRAEQEAQRRREALDQARLAGQDLVVQVRTLDEQLKATDLEPAELLAGLPEGADPLEWEQELERIAGRIQRLGPINLAAIDELREQRERKRYLDEQHADIATSLDTLEEAIRRIDRETRTRFKETFDKVNGGLQTLFPRLFGGGHAYLELTGEDLLDTGVTVMARPPGKRNSSIHLLSGGEKALTAVALVFAIFQLNPAPFCMLDEVDAPLDDANVGRFCELVRSMAGQIQFIFITHNKVTMELANQLIGVTMHEPGVSRPVSVDVEEAVRLAAV
jgi:chromosome segregation protein